MRGNYYELFYASEYIEATVIKQKIRDIQRKIIGKNTLIVEFSGLYIKTKDPLPKNTRGHIIKAQGKKKICKTENLIYLKPDVSSLISENR